MTSITLKAPAKVNLFLKILNKRKDSYHNILTLFERISLSDEIRISKIRKGIEVSADKPITRDPRDNLVYKAAQSIMSKKRLKTGVRIFIKKRIPIAAGMGGGSSDAASALIGIDKLFKLRLGDKELARLAGQLGADVPFFMANTPFAIGRARGDLLERMPSTGRLWHIIIYPGLKMPTGDVYRAFDDLKKAGPRAESRGLTPRHGSGSSPEHLPKGLTTGNADAKIISCFGDALDFGALETMLYNDLQDVVVAKEKAVGKVIKRLASLLGKRAIVSGSGPSVFCLFRSRREAMKAKDLLSSGIPAGKGRLWQIFVAATI